MNKKRKPDFLKGATLVPISEQKKLRETGRDDQVVTLVCHDSNNTIHRCELKESFDFADPITTDNVISGMNCKGEIICCPGWTADEKSRTCVVNPSYKPEKPDPDPENPEPEPEKPGNGSGTEGGSGTDGDSGADSGSGSGNGSGTGSGSGNGGGGETPPPVGNRRLL